MATLLDTIEGQTIPEHRPWPRLVVDEDGWRFAASRLSAGSWTLLGLWGDIGGVHMAVLDEGARGIAVVTIPCPDGRFPSVGAVHPPAIRLERAVRDLYGLEPVGCPDTRPWLDLGFWDVQHPLGERRNAAAGRAPYPFLPTAGEGLYQIPVGPVHAGIIEPGHFRFTANGETVVRLEQRLGYVHKGIEALMAGASLDTAARLAGRTSGDSTVAYALAFAHAGRGGNRRRGSTPCHLSAGADGRARTPRQSFWGYRGHLQRCVVLAHARPVRHPARKNLARRGVVLRPSAHDLSLIHI